MKILCHYIPFLFLFFSFWQISADTKKTTLMQRHKMNQAIYFFGRVYSFLDLKNMISTDANDCCGKKWP